MKSLAVPLSILVITGCAALSAIAASATGSAGMVTAGLSRSSLRPEAEHQDLPGASKLVRSGTGPTRDPMEQLRDARRLRQQKDYLRAEPLLRDLIQTKPSQQSYRLALLEMASLAQDQQQFTPAMDFLAQYLHDFKDDADNAEVLLRQGLLYREMGAPNLALTKFYAVMSSALGMKSEKLEHYQRLVLRAQSEIAETYFLDGKYSAATEFLKRLLRLEHPDLDREQAQYKLVRSCAGAGNHSQVTVHARQFLNSHSDSALAPEVRFMLATSLKNLGRKQDAYDEVLTLLRWNQDRLGTNQDNLRYWQQKTGNEIANQLYTEGDNVGALEIYLKLADANASPQWRLSALYQAALIYERLQQPSKASSLYDTVLAEAKAAGAPVPASVQFLLEMAAWRRDHIQWQTKTEMANRELSAGSGDQSARKL